MKRMPGKLSVSFINKTFFPDYQDVSVINKGECFLWAYTAYCLYRDVELWYMYAHAFVRSKRNGLFYDSERPHGVEDWKDLPATNMGNGCGCGDCKKPATKLLTPRKFRHTWRGMAKRCNVNYRELHKKIRQVIDSCS